MSVPGHKPTGAPADWQSQRERSTVAMLRAMLWAVRHLGRTLTRVSLLPITAYFLVTGADARRASREYLRRVLGRAPSLLDLARHIHCFASVVLDRMFLMTEGFRGIEVKEYRRPGEWRVGTPGRGSLLFVSHLGSFEALRLAGIERGHGRMKFLLDRRQGRMLTAILEAVNPGVATSIIDTSQSAPTLALQIRQALDDGINVGVMVDRARPGEATVSAPFLGMAAAFPIAPWQLAAVLQARVVLGFCVFRGGRRYDAHFEVFADRLEAPRARREQELHVCVQRYAQRLEHYVKLAPYNWFNFYDFWAMPGTSTR
jgi:predicted LPLAT superfamily acyltransferase